MDWPLKIKETGMSLWVNKFRIQYCNKFEKKRQRDSLWNIFNGSLNLFYLGERFSLPSFECNCIREMFERKKKNTNLVFFSRHMSQNAYIFYTRCSNIILPALQTQSDERGRWGVKHRKNCECCPVSQLIVR